MEIAATSALLGVTLMHTRRGNNDRATTARGMLGKRQNSKRDTLYARRREDFARF